MPSARMPLKAPRELSSPGQAVGAVGEGRTASARSPAFEPARRRLVSIVLVIYLLAILEGALRKYAAPQFGQYIFFIRDPFLLYAYLLAWRHGMWPRDNGFLKVAFAMCVAGVPLMAVQMVVSPPSDIRLLLGVYGWRGYCFYLPLAFLVGEQFRSADVLRLAKITLWLAMPIAVLVTAQFFAAPDAPINVGFAAEKELQFKGLGLTAEHTRPTGTFTSSAGQQQYVAAACVMLLAFLLLPAARRRFGIVPLAASAAAVLTCIALGGSRGTMIQCAISGLFAMGIGVVGRSGALKAKAVALPLLLAVAAVVLYPIVFPEGFEAFVSRWNAAQSYESTVVEGGVFGRALYGVVDFIRLIDTVPLLGYGLGYGGNAAITLKAEIDGVVVGYLAESDFARHMVDLGPIFGLGYIAYRLALLAWLTRVVLMATRRVADPFPMMLFAFASISLFGGQISGHGTVNVFGWLFTGLCIAATREAFASTRTRRPAVAGSPIAARPRPAPGRTVGHPRGPSRRRPSESLSPGQS